MARTRRKIKQCLACGADVLWGEHQELGVSMSVDVEAKKIGPYTFVGGLQSHIIIRDPGGHIGGPHYYRHRCLKWVEAA